MSWFGDCWSKKVVIVLYKPWVAWKTNSMDGLRKETLTKDTYLLGALNWWSSLMSSLSVPTLWPLIYVLKILFIYLYVCICEYVYRCPYRLEDDLGFPGAGVGMSYLTWVLGAKADGSSVKLVHAHNCWTISSLPLVTSSESVFFVIQDSL